MITLKHLSKTYRTTEVETTALRDINLKVAVGEFVAVMGPSGCGKSTFLNIVGMLDSPSTGEYWFGEHNIAGYSESQLSELRKNSIGFVFQSFNLIDELNVQENVELALLYHADVPASERKKRAAEALEPMGDGLSVGRLEFELCQVVLVKALQMLAKVRMMKLRENPPILRDAEPEKRPGEGFSPADGVLLVQPVARHISVNIFFDARSPHICGMTENVRYCHESNLLAERTRFHNRASDDFSQIASPDRVQRSSHVRESTDLACRSAAVCGLPVCGIHVRQCLADGLVNLGG